MYQQIYLKPISWKKTTNLLTCLGYTPNKKKVFFKVTCDPDSFFCNKQFGPYDWIKISKYSPIMDEVADFNLSTTPDYLFPSDIEHSHIQLKLLYFNITNSAYLILTEENFSRSYVITYDENEFIPEGTTKVVVNNRKELLTRFFSFCSILNPDRIISNYNLQTIIEEATNLGIQIPQKLNDKTFCGPEFVNMTQCTQLGFDGSKPIAKSLEVVCNKLKLTIDELCSSDLQTLIKLIIRSVDKEVKDLVVTIPKFQEQSKFNEKSFLYDYSVVYLRIMRKSKQKFVRQLSKVLSGCPSKVIMGVFYSSYIDKTELLPELEKFLKTDSIVSFDGTILVSTKVVKTLPLIEIIEN